MYLSLYGPFCFGRIGKPGVNCQMPCFVTVKDPFPKYQTVLSVASAGLSVAHVGVDDDLMRWRATCIGVT